MTVAELIEILKKHQQDLQVVYECCSEYCILEKEPKIVELCKARPDGWVADKRPDKSTQQYLKLC